VECVCAAVWREVKSLNHRACRKSAISGQTQREAYSLYVPLLELITLVVRDTRRAIYVAVICLNATHDKTVKQNRNIDPRPSVNPFVTSGTCMSHLQRVFSSPLG